jgi:hypothetical protein
MKWKKIQSNVRGCLSGRDGTWLYHSRCPTSLGISRVSHLQRRTLGGKYIGLEFVDMLVLGDVTQRQVDSGVLPLRNIDQGSVPKRGSA